MEETRTKVANQIVTAWDLETLDFVLHTLNHKDSMALSARTGAAGKKFSGGPGPCVCFVAYLLNQMRWTMTILYMLCF